MGGDTNLTSKLERVMRLYQALGHSSGLRPGQWDALRYFDSAPADKRTVSGLARWRHSTLGTASVTVSTLVERGLIERGNENRNVGLRTSEAGRRLIEGDHPAKALSKAIEALPEPDRQTLARLLDRIDTELRASNLRTAPCGSRRRPAAG